VELVAICDEACHVGLLALREHGGAASTYGFIEGRVVRAYETERSPSCGSGYVAPRASATFAASLFLLFGGMGR
jgi:hypothetical protein